MAYAALLSLSRILHQTLNRDYQYLILDEKKQIESLVEEVTFLQNCLSSQKITQDMETKIRDAAYIAEDIIESRIIDRFLTESAGHEDGSKEKILIRFDVIESWFVNSSKSASSILSTPMGFESLEPEIAELGGIERLATYGTKMVIINDSPLLPSTIMAELRIHGFDTSLLVGAITSEDLRRDDASLEGQGSIVPEMYKSAMVMAGGVDAADCIAFGNRLDDIKGANTAGISSVFVAQKAFPFELAARHDALARPSYMLPSFTW